MYIHTFTCGQCRLSHVVAAMEGSWKEHVSGAYQDVQHVPLIVLYIRYIHIHSLAASVACQSHAAAVTQWFSWKEYRVHSGSI